LHEDGIESAQQLVSGFDAQRLSQLKRPWGDREQKVGKKAEKILVYAEVLISGKERVLAPAAIPAHENYVMFDLEGMPPHLDELDKIYLWGMQVYGKRPSAFNGVTAGFGPDGDREGWSGFLGAAAKIFAEYGDIPFVHWHHYEKTHVSQYVNRYGDPDGAAPRVEGLGEVDRTVQGLWDSAINWSNEIMRLACRDFATACLKDLSSVTKTYEGSVR
jgi:hypothetical protein